MYLVESTLYISLFIFLVVAVVIYKFAGGRSLKGINTARIVSAARLTSEQMRCHGVWIGQLPDTTFYICIYEIGQFIEGMYFQDDKRILFTGTYLAPELTFDVLDENGSTKAFKGRVDSQGGTVSGLCSETTESPWSAKLLSKPSQTKGLHLDVLARLTLTYVLPDEPEERAKLLAEFGGVSADESVPNSGNGSVRVWKVAPELQGKSEGGAQAYGEASFANPAISVIPAPVPVDASGAVPVPVPAVAPSPLGVSTSLPSTVVLTSAVAPAPEKQDYVTSLLLATGDANSGNAEAEGEPLCPMCQSPFDRGFSFCLRCGHVPSPGNQ